ncbi:MAG: hypothetical protein ACRD5J_20300, partial [Nitrososphaeraceae archaeon]
MKFKGRNSFPNVLTTLGLEKDPMTLALFGPTLRKLCDSITGTTHNSPRDIWFFSLPIVISTVPSA